MQKNILLSQLTSHLGNPCNKSKTWWAWKDANDKNQSNLVMLDKKTKSHNVVRVKVNKKEFHNLVSFIDSIGFSWREDNIKSNFFSRVKVRVPNNPSQNNLYAVIALIEFSKYQSNP